LLKSRKFLKSFFFYTKKVRQIKVTKSILLNQKHFFQKNSSYEYTLLNVLLRSHFFLFVKDAIKFIKKGFVMLNGVYCNKYDTTIVVGDCIQLSVFASFYKYFLFYKNLIKKNLILYKHNSWKLFKQKILKKQQQLKIKKRKLPKYLYLFFLFKVNIPKIFEIDYLTLSLFFLKKNNIFLQNSYYLNKLFSFKLFSLYNFKKIN